MGLNQTQEEKEKFQDFLWADEGGVRREIYPEIIKIYFDEFDKLWKESIPINEFLDSLNVNEKQLNQLRYLLLL